MASRKRVIKDADRVTLTAAEAFVESKPKVCMPGRRGPPGPRGSITGPPRANNASGTPSGAAGAPSGVAPVPAPSGAAGTASGAPVPVPAPAATAAATTSGASSPVRVAEPIVAAIKAKATELNEAYTAALAAPPTPNPGRFSFNKNGTGAKTSKVKKALEAAAKAAVAADRSEYLKNRIEALLTSPYVEGASTNNVVYGKTAFTALGGAATEAVYTKAKDSAYADIFTAINKESATLPIDHKVIKNAIDYIKNYGRKVGVLPKSGGSSRKLHKRTNKRTTRRR